MSSVEIRHPVKRALTGWREPAAMPRYRRLHVKGGSYFFTVALADRRSDLLVREIALLRDACRKVLAARPVRVDAMVVLPDHLHAVWTLPEGDSDFSRRWAAIKARFSRAARRAGLIPPGVWGAAG